MKLLISSLIIASFLIIISIFSNHPNPAQTTPLLLQPTHIPERPVLSLIATGDMMLGRSVNVNSHKFGFQWPFKNVHKLLSEADLTLSNLESPLGYDCPLTNEGMQFCGDAQFASEINESGIDIVTLANNHGADQKESGIEITKTILTSHNIDYIGSIEQPHITTVKGITIGFLGYNTVPPESKLIPWGTTEKVAKDITALNETVDVVIVTFHWGNEYTDTISDLQRELAYASVDAGADFIIGHHPHWVQSYEYYNGKPIYYSLGNFIFDQMWSQRTQEGIVLDCSISKDGIVHINHIPIVIENYGQPRVATTEEGSLILKNLESSI